jgi:hypothetical protein
MDWGIYRRRSFVVLDLRRARFYYHRRDGCIRERERYPCKLGSKREACLVAAGISNLGIDHETVTGQREEEEASSTYATKSEMNHLRALHVLFNPS